MEEKTMSVTGGCMCGAVRYEAIGEPMVVGYCHCRSCRRHTGAPVVAFVTFEADEVRFTKRDRSIYNSSPGVERGFCDQCGTPLTWEGDYREHVIYFHISTLDDPDAYIPELHWHHEERIAWFDVADALPRYRGGGEEPYRHGPASTTIWEPREPRTIPITSPPGKPPNAARSDALVPGQLLAEVGCE